MPKLRKAIAAYRVLHRDGARAVVSKIAQQGSNYAREKFAWPLSDFPLLPEDIFLAGVAEARTEVPQPNVPTLATAQRKLSIGWVCLPPSAGSGGHTTLFRMVREAEKRGHQCIIFLYDKSDEDVSRHEATIRASWPELQAEVRSARPTISGVDAVIASSWETAHVIAHRSDPSVPRFYFVQDFEPFFYPRGYLWELAEDTYRFGFHLIALGSMVSHCLETFAGTAPQTVVPFGCDTAVYHRSALGDLGTNSAPDGGTAANAVTSRTGVVFYAKTGADRRGYWLAREALEQFHELHPEQEIHVVGDAPAGWRIPVTVHGSVTPAKLNAIYNQVVAGVALSFTNISLAAEEMLAAGAIPVVNDSPLARMDLPGAGPCWAAATPVGIAQALAGLVEMSGEELAARANSAVLHAGWDVTGGLVVDAIEEGMGHGSTH